MNNKAQDTIKRIDWIVKQPGEHGKKLRVVERIGLSVEDKEICAGVCEILTSRTSADNFSDATEQKRARLISAAPDLLEACKLVERAHVGDGVQMSTAVDACLLAIKKAGAQ